MRNLTIRRIKSFVGCVSNANIYIQSPSSNEIVINNFPCRKLGVLKNGEEKTFLIDDNEARLFVIADKLSKNYCGDIYKIPQGDNDIFVSGKNHFNPTSGNAFRFDGAADAEVMQYRKAGTRKGSVILSIALIFGIALGLGGYELISSSIKSKPKTFTSNGMQITLTGDFSENSFADYTVCYTSQKAAVFVLKENFSLIDGFEDISLKQYGEIVIANNDPDSDIKLQNSDGLSYFEYNAKSSMDNQDFHYLSFIYKSSDAFWLIQFTASEKDIDQYRENFFDWAKTVEFDASSAL